MAHHAPFSLARYHRFTQSIHTLSISAINKSKIDKSYTSILKASFQEFNDFLLKSNNQRSTNFHKVIITRLTKEDFKVLKDLTAGNQVLTKKMGFISFMKVISFNKKYSNNDLKDEDYRKTLKILSKYENDLN